MTPWTERFPGRLERELEEFREAGLAFELDQERLDDLGQVALRGKIPHGDGEVELVVVYPDTFPYTRPEVFAPGLRLGRHQNPYLGNLCLLERSTREWDPTDSAAWLVSERVPYLLALLEGDDATMREAEAPQGEPASSYFEPYPGAAVFVPAEVLQIDKGESAGSGRLGFTLQEPASLVLRAAVVELAARGSKGRQRPIAKAGEPLSTRFGATVLPFRWVRLDELPTDNSPAAVFAAAEAAQSGFSSPPWRSVQGGEVAVCAIVFSEEVAQGVWEDAWIFAVRTRQAGAAVRSYLIRGERLTPDDLWARIPALRPLGDKTVALAGLGALGAPLARQLAAGGLGELRALDGDRVELGSTVRWAAGISAASHFKTEYLRRWLEYDHPFTRFVPFRHHLGVSALMDTGREETELDLLDRFVSGADLLIDATAEIGIQQLLADAADVRRMNQIYVSATEGAQGGIVARVVPGSGGCWLCLQHALQDGSIPPPPADPSATTQPRGCAARTFTGAAFDLLPIIAEAARVSAATLSMAASQSEVWVCELAGDPDEPPSWDRHALPVHSDCPRCRGEVVEA
ncbi:MAG: ThiF family adenylyltransferase, partial [Solirubrobacterales bacterium]